MREYHYIDIDEEIITAVGRLRQSNQVENVFIFPKRSLILQSVVNLRLLEREANKLQKQLIVVSQDESGKKLAEKAGLRVEEYQQQNLQEAQSTPSTRLTVEQTGGTIPLPHTAVQPKPSQRSADIGSQHFYASPGIHRTPESKPLASAQGTVLAPRMLPEKKLAVRNLSPPLQTSLNSKRSDGVTAPVLPRSVFSQTLPTPNIPSRNSAALPPTPAPLAEIAPEAKLRRFMAGKQRESTQQSQNLNEALPIAREPIEAPTVAPLGTATTKKGKSVGIGVLVLIFMAGIAGLGWYVLFPKAVVTVQPRTAEQVVRLQLTGVTEEPTESSEIPVRLLRLEKTVRVSGQATGSSDGSDTKARGTIWIYNDFSTESQPLVATTRFETKDGKIYRLVEGVTVPGIKETNGKRERGMIEAVVVADQPGENYRLSGETSFTIPGFRGSAKYEKFSAESLKGFTGGGATPGSGTLSVSTDDVKRTAETALAEAKKHILEEMRSGLQSHEVVIEDSLQVTEKAGVSTPPVGGVGSDFDYEARYDAQAFVVSETIIGDRIQKERVTTNGVSLVPERYSLRYGALLPRYESGRIDMTIESTVLFQATLEPESLKKNLLGLDEQGIRSFLEDHPEVERLQVTFDPQLFIATIPKNENRVLIQIRSEQPSED